MLHTTCGPLTAAAISCSGCIIISRMLAWRTSRACGSLLRIASALGLCDPCAFFMHTLEQRGTSESSRSSSPSFFTEKFEKSDAPARLID